MMLLNGIPSITTVRPKDLQARDQPGLPQGSEASVFYVPYWRVKEAVGIVSWLKQCLLANITKSINY